PSPHAGHPAAPPGLKRDGPASPAPVGRPEGSAFRDGRPSVLAFQQGGGKAPKRVPDRQGAVLDLELFPRNGVDPSHGRIAGYPDARVSPNVPSQGRRSFRNESGEEAGNDGNAPVLSEGAREGQNAVLMRAFRSQGEVFPVLEHGGLGGPGLEGAVDQEKFGAAVIGAREHVAQ